MNTILKIYFLFSIIIIGSCSDNILETKVYNNGINIIPKPQMLSQNEGFFELNASTIFVVNSDDERKIATFFADKLKQSTGFQFAISKKPVRSSILLNIDDKSKLGIEDYTLSVTKDSVVVNAKSIQGLFYAMSSLIQLLPAEIESSKKSNRIKWMIPCVEIQDSPRFEYRGYMLHVAQHFIPMDYIKKHLDVLALLKINKFHLHLTDNQEWKVERFPTLTEYSSKSIDTLSKKHPELYTQEKLKELIKYAAERYITITPEIDVQTHAIVACSACPEMNQDIIMTSNNSGISLNYYQGDPKVEPVCIGGRTHLEDIYSYDSIPQIIREKRQGGFVKGVQANMCSEYIYDVNQLEYQLFPNIFALAEISWTDFENKDFADFYRRVNNAYVRLDFRNINYHIPQPEQQFGSSNHVAFTDSVDISFKTTRPIDMVYTIDGTEPTSSSPKYSERLKFTTSSTIKIASLLPSGKMSKTRTIKVEKQEFSPAIKLNNPIQGLSMITTDGTCYKSSDLKEISNWISVKIKYLKEITSVDNAPKWKRDVDTYSAIATGYVNIPEDEVYFLSSNYTEVWIDDKLVIDNNEKAKQHSRNDSSIALKKGWHNLKIVFIGNLVGGLSYWDEGTIAYRKSDSPRFADITPIMLAH